MDSLDGHEQGICSSPRFAQFSAAPGLTRLGHVILSSPVIQSACVFKERESHGDADS